MEFIELLNLENAVDRADLEARLATGAVVALMTASSFGSFLRGPAFAMVV